jgi:hypothetical protein
MTGEMGFWVLSAKLAMSALGHKQTSDWRPLMSALPPKADIVERDGNVRFVLPAQPVDATLALNLPPCRAAWQ